MIGFILFKGGLETLKVDAILTGATQKDDCSVGNKMRLQYSTLLKDTISFLCVPKIEKEGLIDGSKNEWLLPS